MCCGNYEGLEAALAAPGGEGVMAARVFATRPGDRLTIGGFGIATEKEGVEVPEEVAARFEQEIKGEVEVEVEDPAHPGKMKREKQKVPGGGRKDIRVERDGHAHKAHAPDKGKEK